MKKRFAKGAISVLLSVLMVISGIVPTMSAFAGDGVEGFYDLQIFYKATDTIVPTYQEDGVTEYIEYMHEGDELELKYQLIDSMWPDNGYVKWHSENPVLADVTNEGVVKAFDSSKGAVIKSWINNEVRPIPIIGNYMGDALEKIFFNDKIDLDSMDTEEIVDIVIKFFGSDSFLQDYIDAYQGELIDSLREYLDKVNTPIVCELYDKDGTLLATDSFKVTVLKCEEWYANFLPNGTHITNKNSINTTQAAGGEAQLYAITTPQRLGFGTVYTVKSSSIFSTGKVVATVNDSGLVSFKNKGKATILASPDSEQVIQAFLELINYFYALENTGTLNTDEIAQILIDYMGVDINREVLKALLDTAFAIKEIAGDTADPVQLTATAVEIIANIILQMKYNDSITFTVVDAVPITNFDIDTNNVTTVKEGAMLQFGITNVQPDAGDTSDIVWSSSDPTVAMVDPETGIITGLDAGGSLGSMSTKQVEITATSKANNVSKSVTVTVSGKTGKYISHAAIIGDDMVDIDSEANYGYQIYPARVADSSNLYTTWGMVTGEDEEGNEIITWANEETPASDGVGQIDANGKYKSLDGGKSTIVLKAVTGYYLSNQSFYEISSYTAKKEIKTGVPVEKITITCTDGTSNGSKDRDNIVTINETDYEYITIHKGLLEAYAGNGGKFQATIEPANATNQNITWVCDNNYYNQADLSSDTHNVSFKQKAGHEVADTFNVYAVSHDGKVVSNVITVAVVRNYVSKNTINEKEIECINGSTVDATHTVTFNGSIEDTTCALYKANWYSSDPEVFTVETKNNDNRDATITGRDVGVATLYCVSADGGIVDTATVTVKPDKTFLQNIVNLCDKSVVIQTKENRAQYKQYMKKLDLAYAVLYDQDMASQDTCDTYAQNLLSAFYQLGGFVGVGGVDVLGTNKTQLDSKYVTVKVGSTSSYKKYSYNFDYQIKPKNAMYSNVEWTSSNPNVLVDKNGICTPATNDPCSAVITCTVTDYMGNKVSSNAVIAFARTPAEGVELNETNIVGGKVGETFQLTAKISPTNALGKSTASCQDVAWVTSNPKVATVDEKGVITFVYGGDCVIYCTTQDGGLETTCAVNVVTNYDQLQLLINQYNDLSLNSINFYPDTWETFENSMNKAQQMIEKQGYSQKEVDKMYEELEASYNGLKKYVYLQNIELYLDGEQTAEFYQYDLSLLKEGISYKNAILDLNVRLYPNNSAYDTVEWKSSTSDISVTNDGKCSPTSNKSCYGMITCTVTDHFGNAFVDTVWVSYSYVPVTALVLSDESVFGNIGETHQMSCTVEPIGGVINIGDQISSKASIQDYFWESDDDSIATIDENGVITFVSAGSTKIRAVSYDGGVSAECVVSTDGDRSQLLFAIQNASDIDYSSYEYDYGVACKNAYNNAVKIMNDKGARQTEIDDATNALNNAYNAMVAHPYIAPTSIDISYTTYKRSITNSSSTVKSGTIGSNDAISVNLSKDYSNYNNYNDIELSAKVAPENAMYKTITLEVLENKDMKVSNQTNEAIKLTPNNRSTGAWAKIRYTVTDHFGRTYIRDVYVTMSDNIATGVQIQSDDNITLSATDESKELLYFVQGAPEFNSVIWSSSDESVATVENGVVTPVEKGEATITVKTLDGGFTDSVKVTVLTEFSALAEKVNTYNTLINNVTHGKVYTEETLSVLEKAVSDAKDMIEEGTATQAEVTEMIKRLDDAYASLVLYQKADGVVIGYEESVYLSEPNEGYLRYEATSINGRTVQLTSAILPCETAVYKSVEWTSSNPTVSVDSFGLVKNESATAKYSIITCTVTDEDDVEHSSSVVISFVRYGAKAVTFESEMIFGAPQQKKQIKPNLNQSNKNIPSSYINDCKYESSDESVATVDQEGNVTFQTQGEATITVTAYDGGYVGTIIAHTTWDTTALQGAITEAEKLKPTDYAYAQGTELSQALDNAKSVYDNIYASQDEIDQATIRLQTAITDLEGNEFIGADVQITSGDTTVENGLSFGVNENNEVEITASYNDDAMIKSAVWSTSNEVNASATANGNTLVIAKTGDNSSIKITFTVTDDYDRVATYTYSIKLVDAIVSINSINLTIDGVETTNNAYVKSCGGTYTNFTSIKLGYVAYPANATDPASVTWTSSAKNYIAVNENGVLTLTATGKVRSTNTSNITCTITNADGSTISKTINVTINRT